MKSYLRCIISIQYLSKKGMLFILAYVNSQSKFEEKIMRQLICLSITLFIGVHSLAGLPEKITGSDVITGKSFSYDLNKQEKATAIVFISAKCPCSMSHVNHLKELSIANPDIKFVGILSNVTETAELAKSTFENSGFSFPIIMDNKAEYAIAFGAVKTPHVFVVGNEKKILFYGGVTDSSNATQASKFYLKEALNAISKGEQPKEKEARALGCYIQRE